MGLMDAAKWLNPATAAANTVAGMFGGGDKSASESPLETPEQAAAREMLLKFAQTGTFGNFTAGAEVPLGYGDFNTTTHEQQGLSQLQDLLSSSIPENYRLSDQAIADLMDTSQAGIDRQFQPFKALSDRGVRESEAAARRGAGFAGNLYSTNTIKKLGDVYARGNEANAAELGRLNEGALNRKLSAAQLALQSTGAKESAALNRVAASQEYGDLTRKLNDASIKARDAELLRRRTELQLPIQAAGTVLGSNVPFGIKSVESSPYQELLGLAAQIGGSALGNYAGAYGAAKGRTAGSAGAAPTGTYNAYTDRYTA